MKKFGTRNKHSHPLCTHNRPSTVCKDCCGRRICEHSRQRSACKECKALGIGGNSVCEHNERRHLCRECGGFPVVARRMYYNVKDKARRGGLPFNLTIDYILELLGDGICPVLGIVYNNTSHVNVDASPSMDKFIPSLGYVIGNCTVISCLANQIKNSATTEQVQRVADWMRNKEF